MRSAMEYCDIIWDNCYESESSLLEDIQLHGLSRGALWKGLVVQEF